MALTKLNNQSLSAVTSAGLPTGSVLQVVTGTLTSAFNQSANNSSQDTGLTATITPIATSSKIFITTTAPVVLNNTEDAIFYLVRGGANITVQNMWTNVAYTSVNQNFAYLDSPATTSATVYKVMCQKDQNELIYNYINAQSSTAHMILMEIAG